MITRKYDETDIKILDDREHVRKRTAMYLGNTELASYNVPIFNGSKIDIKNLTFIPAVYKCIGEIIDNSVDELIQVDQEKSAITIQANSLLGEFVITDNGRGVPIGMHETGKHAPEVVFTQLKSGRNFIDERESGVIGVNGVGASAVNFCSSSFRVDIKRDGKRYVQQFSDGTLHKTRPVIRKTTSQDTGTAVSFTLDDTIFSDISLPDELIRNRAIEIAASNPGFVVKYNKETFKFKNGFEELLKKAYKNYFRFQYNGLEFFVIHNSEELSEEKIFTWVNSSPLFDGGICNTQFLNSFTDKILEHLAPLAKKNKCQISKLDIRAGLVVFGSLKLQNPQYDSQAKCRLIGPTLRKEIDEMISKQWKSFTRTNKEWLDNILQNAISRHNFETNTKAQKEHKKQLKKKIHGLLDANNKNRMRCSLLITEGDSAASSIAEVRDPEVIASFPLSGKINNVYGCSVANVLSMGKLQDLLLAIGLTPGRPLNPKDLRYGKIIITTDSDPDGGDIFTLLINLFYTYWPELFDTIPPVIYRLVAPLVCCVKGKNRVHFPTLKEFEKVKSKYKGWEINYFKGLGSMVYTDWKMILSTPNSLIPIVNDDKMGGVIELLFGPDASKRKQWLMN